jgi:hypothetical protein
LWYRAKENRAVYFDCFANLLFKSVKIKKAAFHVKAAFYDWFK